MERSRAAAARSAEERCQPATEAAAAEVALAAAAELAAAPLCAEACCLRSKTEAAVVVKEGMVRVEKEGNERKGKRKEFDGQPKEKEKSIFCFFWEVNGFLLFSCFFD